MREGATVAVIGGIANEVALDQVVAAAGDKCPAADAHVRDLAVPDGPTLRLVTNGDGVNYAAGPGNPIEVMDLSFVVQLCALEFLAAHADARDLPHVLLGLPEGTDRRIAALALRAHGIDASAEVPADPVPDWRVTRFSDQGEAQGEKVGGQ